MVLSPTPLKNDGRIVSWDDELPNCFWKVIIHSCFKPPTRESIHWLLGISCFSSMKQILEATASLKGIGLESSRHPRLAHATHPEVFIWLSLVGKRSTTESIVSNHGLSCLRILLFTWNPSEILVKYSEIMWNIVTYLLVT